MNYKISILVDNKTQVIHFNRLRKYNLRPGTDLSKFVESKEKRRTIQVSVNLDLYNQNLIFWKLVANNSCVSNLIVANALNEANVNVAVSNETSTSGGVAIEAATRGAASSEASTSGTASTETAPNGSVNQANQLELQNKEDHELSTDETFFEANQTNSTLAKQPNLFRIEHLGDVRIEQGVEQEEEVGAATGVKCSQCDQVFRNEIGMKIHFGRKHKSTGVPSGGHESL